MAAMMKLRLDPDKLAVDSFATDAIEARCGTVQAHGATEGCTGATYDDTLCGVTWRCTAIPPLC
jgi:hypothetical protein